MATYSETIARICDELTRPIDELGGFAGQQILSAIAHYEEISFPFNRRIIESTLSATNTYSMAQLIPASETDLRAFLTIDDVKVVYSGHEYRLTRLPWDEFYDIDTSTVTSNIPDFWSLYGRYLHIYPTPTTAITAIISGIVLFTTIDGSSVVTNYWLDGGEELIRTRACRMIAMRKLRNLEMAGIYEKLEAEAFRSLKDADNTRHQSGILAAHY